MEAARFPTTVSRGSHQLAWFDWMLLVPYFILLGILAVYGAHRFLVVYGYLKGRKLVPTSPPKHFEQLPRVTIQLPLFNERNVVDQLVNAILKIRYPHDLLQISRYSTILPPMRRTLTRKPWWRV